MQHNWYEVAGGVVGFFLAKVLVNIVWGILTDPIAAQFWKHARAWANRDHQPRSALKCTDCRPQLTPKL